MRKQSKSMSVFAFFMAFIAMGLFFAGMTRTVEAQPPCTLPAVCEALEAINAKLEPVPCEGAPVAKTGQTTSYETGDDGDLEMGVEVTGPRFTDNGDGTVTDNLTGLIWLKNANCFGAKTWTQALSDCNNLADGNCGLSDSSSAGDWRLPNLRELNSLIDYGRYDPALPDGGTSFDNVQSDYYWSSTTVADNTARAWIVYLYNGYVGTYAKGYDLPVWCVRGGQ